jgi:hypothetical protein
MTEHERLRGTMSTRGELFLQRGDRDISEGNAPSSGPALGCSDLVPDERLPDMEPSFEEFHVLPAQTQ